MARYDLGLTSEEFYGLSPRQYDALVVRHERSTHAQELLFGQLTSAVVNFSMAHPKKPTSAADFMPSEWLKKANHKQEPKLKRRKRKDIAEDLRIVFLGLMKKGK